MLTRERVIGGITHRVEDIRDQTIITAQTVAERLREPLKWIFDQFTMHGKATTVVGLLTPPALTVVGFLTDNMALKIIGGVPTVAEGIIGGCFVGLALGMIIEDIL